MPPYVWWLNDKKYLVSIINQTSFISSGISCYVHVAVFFVTPWHDKLITNQPSVDTMCVLYVYMYKNYSIFNPCMCCVRNNTLMVESKYKNIDSHRCSETLVIIDSNIYLPSVDIPWFLVDIPSGKMIQ